MKKSIILLLLSFCFIGFNNAQNFCAIDPELQQLLEQKNDELIDVNIILKSQIDVDKLESRKLRFDDKESKRDAVLKEFKNFTEESQSDVLSILQAGTRSSSVRDIRSHWITNMINCKVSRDVVRQLAQHPGVAALSYNKREYMLFEEKAENATPLRGMTENVTKVNADKVWDSGYTGKGILVSVLDTGVNTDHVDLKDHLWDGGEQYPNHGYNTLDHSNDVRDNDGHGTHCAGIICGDGTSGTQTGIAPDATLMCIKVLGDDGKGSVDAIISGIEFSVEHYADVLSLSLGASSPDMFTSSMYRSTFTNLLELDVIAAVAAGNDGHRTDEFPVPRNINAPGNCPPAWIHPDQQANAGGTSSIVCVGAVDYNDVPAYFTSEGPVTWVGSEWNDYPIDMSSDIEPGWMYYDNGLFYTGIGGLESFSWGVMFPPSKLQQYENGELTKVSMFDCLAHRGEIEIYQDGNRPDEATLIHSQYYSTDGSNVFVEFELEMPLAIDHTKNLWVIFKTDEGLHGPAAVCGLSENPNGRWLGYESGYGMTWFDMQDIDLSYTWMIRAFVTNFNGEISTLCNDSENEFGLIRPDVCAPGVDIISCAHNSNDSFVSMSGTSMATPCVAGTIALMLEKNPDLTPAQICEALEMSAVKLTDKKDNKTGNGRIDAVAIFDFLDEEQEEECIAPGNITAMAIDNYSIEVSWDASATADEYEVYRDDEKIASVKSLSYTDKELNGKTKYCYTVKSVCDAGISDASDEACAMTLSENVKEQIVSFGIYPNPVEDEIHISSEETIREMTIYNIYGIALSNSQQPTVNVSDLNSGIYFIKIKTDNREIIRQFIKK